MERQAARDVTEHSPNPLVILPLAARQLGTRCEMHTGSGGCQEAAVYQDIYREAVYCPEHGARISALPDVVDKIQLAREMVAVSLVGLGTEAVSVLRDILMDPEVASAVRLKASTEVLDRTGFGKTEQLSVSVGGSGAGEELHEATAADLIRERLSRLAAGSDNVIEFKRNEEE